MTQPSTPSHRIVVRGVGFEPTQAYATGSSTRRPMGNFSGSRYKVNYANIEPIVDNHELDRFYKWCLETSSESTCKQYVSYLRKKLNMGNKWSILAYKKYAKYRGDKELWEALRVKHSRPDLYVPSDKQVFEALERACSISEKLCWVYKLLIYSGARLKEVVKALSMEQWIEVNGFYKLALSWIRGKKQSFYIYSVEKPPAITVSDKWVRNTTKRTLLGAKYIRKWVATKMLSLGIPEEIVNFIQGRTPSQILSKHYLKLSTLADQYYPRYAEWIRTVIT